MLKSSKIRGVLNEKNTLFYNLINWIVGGYMEDLLQVGVITTTHGVRGEVKVFPATDDANRFKKLKEVSKFNPRKV